MKKRDWMFLSCFCVTAVAVISVHATKSYSVDQKIPDIIHDNLKHQEAAITNGSGSFTYEYVYVDSVNSTVKKANTSQNGWVHYNTRKRDVFYAFEGPKRRIETSEVNFVDNVRVLHRQEEVYDGDTSYMIATESGRPSGALQAHGHIGKVYSPWSRLNESMLTGLFTNDTSLSSIFNDSLEDIAALDIQKISEENKDGLECYVLKGETVNDSGNNGKYRIWLSKKHMCRPVFIEVVSPDNVNIAFPPYKTDVRIEYKEHGDGIWFPSCMEKRKFDSRNKLIVKEAITVHDDFTVNCDIDSSVFEMAFPVGLTVFNDLTMEKYEVQ